MKTLTQGLVAAKRDSLRVVAGLSGNGRLGASALTLDLGIGILFASH